MIYVRNKPRHNDDQHVCACWSSPDAGAAPCPWRMSHACVRPEPSSSVWPRAAAGSCMGELVGVLMESSSRVYM